MDSKIKVLIIDDSAVVRKSLESILDSAPDIKVIGTVSDPYFAAEEMKKILSDVITLDIEMPRMDGLTFLKKIMTQNPLPVVICSSLTGDGSQTTLRALEYGAVEIITKPKLQTDLLKKEFRIRITDAVKAAASTKIKKKDVKIFFEIKKKFSADVILSKYDNQALPATTEKIIAIGAFTGGTETNRAIIEKMPLNCPGIVIVQHMPELFTKTFAQRLDKLCDIKVKEAESGDRILRSHALIAPGNKHMLVKRSGANYFVQIKDGPLVNRYRLSVDVLFRYAARYAGSNAIGVILTGMGDDGAQGLLEMKEVAWLRLLRMKKLVLFLVCQRKLSHEMRTQKFYQCMRSFVFYTSHDIFFLFSYIFFDLLNFADFKKLSILSSVFGAVAEKRRNSFSKSLAVSRLIDIPCFSIKSIKKAEPLCFPNRIPESGFPTSSANIF